MVGSRLTFLVIQSEAFALLLLNVGQFSLRIKFFPVDLLRALQRRKAIVGPNSLKVGLAGGRTWRSPRSLRRSRGLRIRRGRRRLAEGGNNRKRQYAHGSK